MVNIFASSSAYFSFYLELLYQVPENLISSLGSLILDDIGYLSIIRIVLYTAKALRVLDYLAYYSTPVPLNKLT